VTRRRTQERPDRVRQHRAGRRRVARAIGPACALALARHGFAGARPPRPPEGIAEAVAFLAVVSPHSIAGEVIDIDGGQVREAADRP
jgi:hypothetical protein